ncbi:MAG: pseudouridine synthase [Lentisphaeria bacterium]
MQPIFLDNHVLVLDKPAGLLTQDSGSGEENLEELAKAWLKLRFQRPGAVFLHAVHRIDRVACGLVLFARSSKALSRLNASLRAGKLQKTYLCGWKAAPLCPRPGWKTTCCMSVFRPV